MIPYQQGAERFRVHYDQHGRPVGAWYPPDAEVMVFQRVVEKGLVDLIGILTARGVAVVVDVDDDLSAIHPANPAWAALHPRNETPERRISWHYLAEACRAASMVTVTTPALAAQYGPHGRVAVIPNYLPQHYYGQEREDGDVIGWPASYFSHPDDPGVTRGAIGRLVGEGHRFQVWGDPAGAGKAFGLPADPEGTGAVGLDLWPRAVAEIGVGIAPLADTRFNAKKSALKVEEMSACGVPWVASPRPDYLRIHRLGAGLLAKDKGPDWYRQVRRLVTDPVMRADLSAAGREVAAGLRLEAHRDLWLGAWQAARDHAQAGRGLART